MSLTRIASVAVLVGAVSLAAGCGGGSDDPDEGALGSTVAPTPASVVPTATSPATTKASPTRTRTPVTSPRPSTTPAGGDGDAVGDDEPPTAGGGVCGKLTASQVGSVIGGAVRGEGLPGGGCEFDHSDPKLPTATVKDVAYAGMEAAKTEATSAVEGEPEDLSGIGAGAFVVTGSVFGGTEVQGAGAVHVGSRTISVSITQHKAMSAAVVRGMVVKLLQLVARQAS